MPFSLHPLFQVKLYAQAAPVSKNALSGALLTALLTFTWSTSAQDLAPRAYIITPTGSSAVIASYSYNTGTVFVDPTVPITDSGVRFQTQILSFYRSFNFLGRSANITVAAPYVFANAKGTIAGSSLEVYRSGLADGRVRLAVNLKGGPAMRAKEFVKWKEKLLIGASLTLLVPNGQYDPARIVNIGTNRWGFKPEIGISRRWRQRWVLEGYAAGWFYTANDSYYPGMSVRTQGPLFAMETHLNYYAKPRLWISLDGNFWSGGQSTLNGSLNADRQRNSRAGITAAIPLNQHQSLKLSYSRGTYVTIGGDYRTISAAWQYSWIGKGE